MFKIDDEDMTGAPWSVKIGRNPSYWSSVKITFSRAMFYSPTALWWMLKPYFVMLFAAVFWLPVLTLLWLVTTFALLVAGLCGRINMPDRVVVEDESDDQTAA